VFSAMVPELPENFPTGKEEIQPHKIEIKEETKDTKISSTLMKESQKELMDNCVPVNENEWREKSKKWISSFHQSIISKENIPKKATPQQIKRVLKKETYNQIKRFSNGKQQ
jgi:hypothetical protein